VRRIYTPALLWPWRLLAGWGAGDVRLWPHLSVADVRRATCSAPVHRVRAVRDETGKGLVARRTKPSAGQPTLEEMLWKAADTLRGSMDAAEYKHFVLGLVFLKYVSDAFIERRQEIERELADEAITGERAARLLEDSDQYVGSGVFWVPPAGRWDTIAQAAKSGAGNKSVGELLDEAMAAIERSNGELHGVLPKIFNRSGVDERRLAGLIDLIGRVGFGQQRGRARDVLGHVYEYCLERFAAAEGKRGGEFYTPQSVVRLLVEVLEPEPGSRVYDPCCGSGGMFVQTERFIETHGGRPFDIAVYGQELNQNTWRLAKMNLAIHGIGANLGPRWADTFHDDLHPDLRADVVLANPPFNMSNWGADRRVMDPRWTYGVPPPGNANFAWLQHIASKLAWRGMAGVVLANGSMASKQSGEGDIRRAMVEDDLIACMVALPSQLFRTTQIPACLWFLARDKTLQGGKRLADRRNEVLFIDARTMGLLVNRTERVLTEGEIARIASTYHVWRGTDRSRGYADEPGFCHSATREEIKQYDYVLTPGRYVATPEAEDDGEPISEKVARLTKDLDVHFEESARLEQEIRRQLGRLDV
jgi:type I restriction enzyme M protein